MKNPFVDGKRVSGQAFFDRAKIKSDIRNVLDGGSNVLLYGPRRYGKSSLMGEVLAEIRAEGGCCAELNMLEDAFRSHSESQRLLMRAIAVEPTGRFDEAYRERHGLKSTSTVNTALRRQIADSTIEKATVGYKLGDPLLAYYLTKR